jgi:hypothetical protein
MFVGSFLLFVIILHFILGKSLKFGGQAGLIVSILFGLIVFSLTQDAAVAVGASTAFAAYTI